MKGNISKDLLFSLSFIFLSLTSIYFFSLQIASLFGLLLATFCLFIFNKRPFVQDFTVILIYVGLFIITALFSAFFVLDADWKRLLAFLLLILSAGVASSLVTQVNVGRVIFIFLCCHITFFYIQFVAYFLFSIHIDYLGAIGIESRNFGGTFKLPIINKMMRASGLFNEPGTYVTFVAPAVALSMRYLTSKPRKRIAYLALLSLALTLSTFGAIFAVIILAITPIKIKVKALLALVFGAFSLPYLYWRFFVRSSFGSSHGMSFREEFIRATIENTSSVNGFFHGVGGFSSTPFNFSSSGAVNDSGLLFTLIYYMGFFPSLLFIFSISLIAIYKGRASTSLVLILMLSKINFFALIMPFYLVFALCDPKKRLARTDMEE